MLNGTIVNQRSVNIGYKIFHQYANEEEYKAVPVGSLYAGPTQTFLDVVHYVDLFMDSGKKHWRWAEIPSSSEYNEITDVCHSSINGELVFLFSFQMETCFYLYINCSTKTIDGCFKEPNVVLTSLLWLQFDWISETSDLCIEKKTPKE